MKTIVKLLLYFFILILGSLELTARDVYVRGYMRKNGTYVAPHYRTSPNSTTSDNWSTKGNINPYTGKEGTQNGSDTILNELVPTTDKTDLAIPIINTSSHEFLISKELSYLEIMNKLKMFQARKKVYGDYLDAFYQHPLLLAYPDAGGECELNFYKTKLKSCKGCDPTKFEC